MNEASRAVGGYVFHANGTIRRDDAGQRIYDDYERARADFERMERTFAGARIAALFKKHAWIASVLLAFTVTYEYDDEGGSYRCISIRLDDLEIVDGVAPADSEGAELDEYERLDYLTEELQDEAGSLYGSFMSEYDDEDLELRVTRASIAHLLHAETVDGNAAYAALFPAYAKESVAA